MLERDKGSVSTLRKAARIERSFVEKSARRIVYSLFPRSQEIYSAPQVPEDAVSMDSGNFGFSFSSDKRYNPSAS